MKAYSPAEVARLIVEAREDNARMLGGKWSTVGRSSILEIESSERHPDGCHIGICEDLRSEDALGIVRTRNNLAAIADQLEAARAEIEGIRTVIECPTCHGWGRLPRHPAAQETGLAQPAHEIIPLSAHATAAKMRISTSPARSVRPISVHVKEPDGTAWRVLTIIVDDIDRWYGDPPYRACRGNCWIDLEVECPHDHPPTETKPIELHGIILCEASDLLVAAGDTERDRQWAADFRKPRGARKLSNGEWQTMFRADACPLPPSTAWEDSNWINEPRCRTCDGVMQENADHIGDCSRNCSEPSFTRCHSRDPALLPRTLAVTDPLSTCRETCRDAVMVRECRDVVVGG